jgi:ATP-dependent helicase/nuclease subunit B
MHGRIDRTDRYEDDGQVALRVIDYKSGSNKLDPTKVYYGIQLQLLVYMNAVCDQVRAGEKVKAVVPAGVFYYHIDDPLIETSLSDELMGTGQIPEGELLKALKMEGLAVGDETDNSLIRVMDRAPQDPPAIMPVAYNKDGISVKRSSIISPDDFAWLSIFVKERQKKLADRIFKGDIAVDPYIYGKDSPCTYCSFKAVCRFEPGSRGYSYRRLKRVAKDEGFGRLAKEAEHGI